MKPSVCMLIERYAPLVGGSETQCRLLAGALHASGIKVFILTRHTDAAQPSHDTVDGIHVHRIGPAGFRRIFTEVGFACATALALVRLRKHFDIVHIHSGTSLTGAIAVMVAKLLNKNVVIKVATAGDIVKQTVHIKGKDTRPSFVHRAMNTFINHMLYRADRILSISKEISEELRANGFPDEQIVELPNAVDTTSFAPISQEQRVARRQELGLPNHRLLVLFSGRLIARKGVDILLRAWYALDGKIRDGATLLILGSGSTSMDSTESQHRAFVHGKNLEGSVLFLGEQPSALSYLLASDVFAFPSRREGLSNALLEAMSCGLAVVASAIGGTVDVCTNESDALLYPCESVEALTDRLTLLLTDVHRREALGMHARERILSSYDMRSLLPRYLALYSTLHA